MTGLLECFGYRLHYLLIYCHVLFSVTDSFAKMLVCQKYDIDEMLSPDDRD